MKIYNPINGGADIQSSNFTLLKGATVMVSDVQGLAILKQWGFLQEVEVVFEPPAVEAPKPAAKVEKVSTPNVDAEDAVVPTVEATEVPVKKAVKKEAKKPAKAAKPAKKKK